MLNNLFTVGINGEMSGGLNTSASNYRSASQKNELLKNLKNHSPEKGQALGLANHFFQRTFFCQTL